MGSLSQSLAIPPEFQAELSYVLPSDNRPGADILASLSRHVPVTSEKNIWCFWHSGVEGMPDWCQRNVIDWHRINGPSWTVRVLDSDASSPNYFLNYVSKAMFPASIINSAMTGPHARQHTADFVRSATVYEHGGVFMDVGCLLVRRLDRVCWDKLSDDKQPWNVGVATVFDPMMSNHFVASRKQDPFIKRWHSLLLHLWQDRTNSTGTVIGNPLVDFLLEYNQLYGLSKVFALGWDFVDVVASLEYVGQILAFERICFLDKEDEEGFNGAKYWTQHVLAWDALPEHWPAEILTNQMGPHPRIMELLATRRDADPKSEQYKAAYDLTWHILTKSSMQKVTSARGLTKTPHLGILWEMPENIGKDHAEGTFAELLRYGSVHFEQKRQEIASGHGKQPDYLLEKALLEP